MPCCRIEALEHEIALDKDGPVVEHSFHEADLRKDKTQFAGSGAMYIHGKRRIDAAQPWRRQGMQLGKSGEWVT